jgi:hypothetical protein
VANSASILSVWSLEMPYSLKHSTRSSIGTRSSHGRVWACARSPHASPPRVTKKFRRRPKMGKRFYEIFSSYHATESLKRMKNPLSTQKCLIRTKLSSV